MTNANKTSCAEPTPQNDPNQRLQVLIAEYKQRSADVRMKFNQFGALWAALLSAAVSLGVKGTLFTEMYESYFVFLLFTWFGIFLYLFTSMETLNHYLFKVSCEITKLTKFYDLKWFIEERPLIWKKVKRQKGSRTTGLVLPLLFIPMYILLGSIAGLYLIKGIEFFKKQGGFWGGVLFTIIAAYVIGTLVLIWFRRLNNKKEEEQMWKTLQINGNNCITNTNTSSLV